MVSEIVLLENVIVYLDSAGTVVNARIVLSVKQLKSVNVMELVSVMHPIQLIDAVVLIATPTVSQTVVSVIAMALVHVQSVKQEYSVNVLLARLRVLRVWELNPAAVLVLAYVKQGLEAPIVNVI